ncbi:MAG: hypothetical protein IPK26_03965 [Planctomycetes bacterium]|nr:hypothetical protein [Planctomycetota bacterium]
MTGVRHQLWHQGAFGNATSTAMVASALQETTAKAMLIATASQWTFSGTTHDQTSTHQRRC